MTTFSLAITAALLVSLLSFSGGVILLSSRLFNKTTLVYLVSFAAGVMLTVTFLELIPEAIDLFQEGRIFFVVLLGIIISFALERLLLWHHHHHMHHGSKSSAVAPLILIGDGLHNLLDGIAIAAAFVASPTIGFVTTIAIALHEIPQELADFSVLIYSGMDKRKALLYNFLSALPAVIGTIIGFVFFSQNDMLLSFAIAFTAGMFIYIALADLVPELHKESVKGKEWIQIFPFLFGVIVIYLLTILVVE